MGRDELVSLVLVVKNGMPFVTEALDSVAAQRHRHLELIVQDGGSTDGTLEAIRARTDIPRLEIESGPDTQSGALARALERCRGAVVGSVLSDDRLEPEACAVAVREFAAHPECAAIYGANRIIDQAGRELQVFEPGAFDLLRLMSCELVPPFASAFFSRPVCGAELRLDPSVVSCCEFDLWLRLGHLPIRRVAPVLGVTRFHGGSNTRRAESYEQFCRDKIEMLDRHLARQRAGPVLAAVRAHSVAGIYGWAAGSLLDLEGATERFWSFVERARAADPGAPLLATLHARAEDAARRAREEAERARAERERAERERAEQACLAARLGRMAGRAPLADGEMQAAADALAAILNARDIPAHLAARRGALPAGVLPLLAVHLARVWAGSEPAAAEGLEWLYGLLASGGAGGGEAACPSRW